FLGSLEVLGSLGGIIAADVLEHLLIGGEVRSVGAGGELRGNRGVGGQRAVLHNVFHDGYAVNSVGQGQTHILVGQGRNLRLVQGQVPQVAGAVDAQLGIALNLVDLVTAQFHDIQIAVLVAHERLLAVLDDL